MKNFYVNTLLQIIMIISVKSNANLTQTVVAHYENIPIQIYRKFHLQGKKLLFFIFLLKT